MSKTTDVVTIYNIGKNGVKSVTKFKVNDDGTLGKKVSSGEKTIRYAKENAKTILPHGGCVPYAVFHGGCNDNLVSIAASGGGKTRSVVEPNIISEVGSMVISDPKGYLYGKYASKLKADGYEIIHLDFIHAAKSMGYNPFEYIHSYEDVLKIATMITYLERNVFTTADPFWDKAAVLLLSSLIGYLYEGGSQAHKNFYGVTKLLSSFDTDAIENGKKCAIDRIFEAHNIRFKEQHGGEPSWAYEQYQKFLGLGRKTLSCVIMTIQADLGRLDVPEIRKMTEKDETNISSIGQKKTAVFVEVSDTDRSKDLLINIFYSQAMSVLCDYADSLESHRLPVPVRFILDDFGTTSKIEGFDNMISNIRSRGISAMLMIQSIAQLKKYYDISYQTILNNCDTTIYLGGSNYETAQYIAQLVNKTPSTVLSMPMKKCWIFRRGGHKQLADIVDIDYYTQRRRENEITNEI